MSWDTIYVGATKCSWESILHWPCSGRGQGTSKGWARVAVGLSWQRPCCWAWYTDAVGMLDSAGQEWGGHGRFVGMGTRRAVRVAGKQHQSDNLGSDSCFPLAGGGSGKNQTLRSKLEWEAYSVWGRLKNVKKTDSWMNFLYPLIICLCTSCSRGQWEWQKPELYL